MEIKLIEGLEKIKVFAQSNTDVQAILCYGSSIGSGKDKYSDLDFFLFTTTPGKYLNESSTKWANTLGKIVSRVVDTDGEEVNVNKLMLEDGLCIDFITVDAKKFKQLKLYFNLKRKGLHKMFPLKIRAKIDAGTNNLYKILKRGYKLIYNNGDYDKILDAITESCAGNKRIIVTPAKFDRNQNIFWQTCYKMTVKLIRKDLYNALIFQNGVLKRKLIEMLEWQTQLTNENCDVISEGLKISKWADPAMVEKLYTTFPLSDIKEARQSLMNSIDLYKELSHYVSKKENFTINNQLEEMIIAFVQKELPPFNL